MFISQSFSQVSEKWIDWWTDQGSVYSKTEAEQFHCDGQSLSVNLCSIPQPKRQDCKCKWPKCIPSVRWLGSATECSDIWEELKVELLLLSVEKSQWRWFGHLIRMLPVRLPRVCPPWRRTWWEPGRSSRCWWDPAWPGNTLGFSQRSYWKQLGRAVCEPF